MKLKRFTAKEVSKMRGRTDWARLRRMKDKDIDLSDIPELSEEFLKGMVWVGPKVPISLRVDPEVVVWFKRHGRGYQSRMNAVLRAYVQVKKSHKPKKPARRAA